MKNGCKYEAYVKSSTQHKVTIFIKEMKKTTRYKDQPSFTSITDSPLVLEKSEKIKNLPQDHEEKEEEEESIEEETQE
jgi:hypothetical protein